MVAVGTIDLNTPERDHMPTPPQETVPVWDLPTRVFHWVLVAAVTVATVTG